MPSTCVVLNCTNRYDAAINRSFHGFPFSDPDRCQKWIDKISRMQSDGKPWVPSKHSRVCSDHFLPSDFKSETKIRELNYIAIPTVFPTHSDPKQPKSMPRRSFPKKRIFEATQSTSKATECDESASHPDPKQPKTKPRRSFPKKRIFEATPSTSKATECDESASHPDPKQPKSMPRRSSPKKRFFEATLSTSKATECDESASKYISLTEHSYSLPNIETELEIKERELKKMGEKLAEKNKEINVLNQKLKERDFKIAKLLTKMERMKKLFIMSSTTY